MSKVQAPKSPAGWLWLAAAGFAVLTFGTKGGEVSDGFGQGFSDTCAPFFAADPGEAPSTLSPGCDSNGNRYGTGSRPAEVAVSAFEDGSP